tara:strand:+ start:593 stop:790 length:198 start_codon:yes stop_codon:yes gene_type:complete
MKIFLVLIMCLQNPTLPLNKTCVALPTQETFQTVNDCLFFLDDVKRQLYRPDVYITGFCTAKDII